MKQLSGLTISRGTLFFLSIVFMQLGWAQDDNNKPVWQVGVYDGYPQNPSQPVRNKEFGRLYAPGNYVTIGSASSFPQRINPGQTVAMKFAKMPAKNYRFVLVVNVANQPKDLAPWITSPQKFLVDIQFNSVPVTYKYLPDSHNTITAFVPADRVLGSENVLAIKNAGSEGLAIDSAWLEPARDRQKIWVGLSESQWLDSKQSQSISHMILNYRPTSEELAKEAVDTLVLEPIHHENSLRKRRQLWKQTDWITLINKIKEGDVVVGNQAERWQKDIANVFARGSEPVLVIGIENRKHPTWLRLFALFAPYVEYWYLDYSDMEFASLHIDLLNRIAPEIMPAIVCRGKLNLQAANLRSTYLTYPGHRLKYTRQRVADFRQSLISLGVDHDVVAGLSVISRNLDGIRNLEDQYSRAAEIPKFILENLNSGVDRILLHGGRFGGSIFPEGSGKPSVVWPVLQPFLSLGHGSGERVPCNLVGTDRRWFRDVTWCAVAYSSSHVDLLVHAGLDSGREAKVECMVPWNGGTVVETVSYVLRGKNPPELAEENTIRVRAEASDKWGVIRLNLPLSNLAILRMRSSKGGFYSAKDDALQATIHPADPFRTGIFKSMSGHYDEGEWVVDLMGHLPRRDYSRLGAETMVKVVSATPGDIGVKQGVVPWRDKSLSLTYSPEKYVKNRPAGVSFNLDLKRYSDAESLDIWAYPKGDYTGQFIPFIIGTRLRPETVLLKKNIWNRIRVSLERLVPVRLNGPMVLLIKPSPDVIKAKKSVELELNAINAIGKRVSRKPVSIRPGIEEIEVSDKEIILLVSARADMPTMIHYTLNDSINPRKLIGSQKDLMIDYFSGSNLVRIGTESMPKDPLPSTFVNAIPESYRKKLPLSREGVIGLRILGK